MRRDRTQRVILHVEQNMDRMGGNDPVNQDCAKKSAMNQIGFAAQVSIGA